MIFKIKYNFVDLELIGQPYFDLKRNTVKMYEINDYKINCFRIDSLSSNLRNKTTHLSIDATLLSCGLLYNRETILAYYASWKKLFLQNLYLTVISNHNKMRRPRPKFKVSFYLYFCCFWINVTQINFENIKRKIQRIISNSCFQLKSWFNIDVRAPSIPLLNFPFKSVSLEF